MATQPQFPLPSGERNSTTPTRSSVWRSLRSYLLTWDEGRVGRELEEKLDQVLHGHDPPGVRRCVAGLAVLFHHLSHREKLVPSSNTPAVRQTLVTKVSPSSLQPAIRRAPAAMHTIGGTSRSGLAPRAEVELRLTGRGARARARVCAKQAPPRISLPGPLYIRARRSPHI